MSYQCGECQCGGCICCGECIYSKFDREIHEFYCSNEDSDNYGISTAYNDSCPEGEKRY